MALSQLTKIHVTGFRSLRDVTLELGSKTVLIGANGAGKSNLLSLLRMVSLMRTKSLRRYVGEQGGASKILYRGPKRTPQLSIGLEFAQGKDTPRYHVRLGYGADDSFVFLEESAAVRQGLAPQILGVGHVESSLNEASKGSAQWVMNGLVEGMNFFHFHDTSASSPLRQNSLRVDDRFLRSYGENLAAFLHRLRTAEDEPSQHAWNQIEGLVRRVAPFIKNLAPELVAPGANNSAVRLDWIDQHDDRFSASDLSDGTLRAIALFTALAQPEATLPRFIAIDEPELGLHPVALQLLADLVHSVSTRCQIMLSTQSPALLDAFEPKDVVVVDQKDGESVFRHLDEEVLRDWLDDYSLSELQRKNVLPGGRP